MTKFKKKPVYKEMNKEIEGLEKKEFNNGNVIRYYDGETYVLYRKYYEGTNMLQFEDVMTPASKKELNVENITLTVNFIEKYTFHQKHSSKF